MIVTGNRDIGLQVYRVYRQSIGSILPYTGLQVYRESTERIQAEFWCGHSQVFYLSEYVSACRFCEACPIVNTAFGVSQFIMHGCSHGAILGSMC